MTWILLFDQERSGLFKKSKKTNRKFEVFATFDKILFKNLQYNKEFVKFELLISEPSFLKLK